MIRFTRILFLVLGATALLRAQVVRDLPAKLEKGKDLEQVADDIVCFFDYEFEGEREAVAKAAGAMKDPEQRLTALAALVLADPASVPLHQELARLIEDRKNKHAARLIRLSALCASPHPDLVAALVHNLHRGSVDERAEAALALGRLPINDEALRAELEDALDERDEMVLVQVARAYARKNPTREELEKLEKPIREGKGSKLRGAILVMAEYSDTEFLKVLVPLTEKKSVDAEALWAIGRTCARTDLTLEVVMPLMGIDELESRHQVEKAIALIAAGVPRSFETSEKELLQELVRSKVLKRDELSLAAFKRLGRGIVGSLPLKGKPEDPDWYLFALAGDPAANAGLDLDAALTEAPCDLLWRLQVQLEDEAIAAGRGFDPSQAQLALAVTGVGSGRMLFARFIGEWRREDKLWPAESAAALAATSDAQWLALLPIIHGSPELPLHSVLAPMFERVGPADQMLIDCGRAYVGQAPDRFDAARRALRRFVMSGLHQGLASDMRKDLTKEPALRVQEICRRSTWLLDSCARRLAIVGALERQPWVAPQLLVILGEWLDFEVDSNTSQRLLAVFAEAGSAARGAASVIEHSYPEDSLVDRLRRNLVVELVPDPQGFGAGFRERALLHHQGKLDLHEHRRVQLACEALLRQARKSELTPLLEQMTWGQLGLEFLNRHADKVLQLAPGLIERRFKLWFGQSLPEHALDRAILTKMARENPERLLELDLEEGPCLRLIREELLLAGQTKSVDLEALCRGLRISNQPEISRCLIDAGADAQLVQGQFQATTYPLSMLHRELAERGGERSMAVLFPRLEQLYAGYSEDQEPDLTAVDLLSSAARRAVMDGNVTWTEFLLAQFREDLPPLLLTPILWAIPHGHEGAEAVTNYRRKILLDGGDVELQAIAAHGLALGAQAADLESLDAALESEVAIVAEAACNGLTLGPGVPEGRGAAVCENACVEGENLAVAALRLLATMESTPADLRRAVLVNLESNSALRRVLAAELLPRLDAFTVAEVDVLSRRITEKHQLGHEELIMALAVMERPDPRLRKRLEVGRLDARLSMRVVCSAALAELFSSSFGGLAGHALRELVRGDIEPGPRSARPIDRLRLPGRGAVVFAGSSAGLEPRQVLPASYESLAGLGLRSHEDIRDVLSRRRLSRFVLGVLEPSSGLDAEVVADLERLAILSDDAEVAERARALATKLGQED